MSRQTLAKTISLLLAVSMLIACRNEPVAPGIERLSSASPALQAKARTSLAAADRFEQHVWRDTEPVNPDGTVNGYVEISRGDSNKWEFRIPLNRLEIDRVIPSELRGYPTNYGFLPRTISYDGDPADVLVIGPAVGNGRLVKGRILGLMRMTDTGDLDSKVVISPLDDRGQPLHALESTDRERLTQFFNTYKRHEGKTTEITGWGTDADAVAFLQKTTGFFEAAQSAR
jgi:inorganic pyrophosphatase